MIKASVKEDELNYSAQHDLQSVCNAEVIEWVESTEAELITENGKFTVSLLIDVT